MKFRQKNKKNYKSSNSKREHLEDTLDVFQSINDRSNNIRKAIYTININ